MAVVEAATSDLKLHPRNPRKITPTRLEQLKRNLVADPDMLQARPLIALPDGTVIAGNQRLRAAQELGWTSIPVVYADLDDDRALLWALRDNRPFGEDDTDMVAEILMELSTGGTDLDLTGYAEGELAGLLAGLNQGQTDPDESPPLPGGTPESEPGRLYELGPHRLMCGDACDPEQVASLLSGAAPELCITDPPYGVDYDPAWRQEAAEKGHLAYAPGRVGKVQNDERSAWADAWALAPGDVLYCWHAGRYASSTQTDIESVGFEIRCQIMWSKPHLPISRGHYHWRHEPCWYAVRKGKSAGWIGDRKQTTVWEITLDPNVTGGHSTQKPIECMRRPLRNHSGDVYDPFAGTGTTLIAAEQLQRVCYAMEIDPGYCDVVRERYARFTGQPGLAP